MTVMLPQHIIKDKNCRKLCSHNLHIRVCKRQRLLCWLSELAFLKTVIYLLELTCPQVNAWKINYALDASLAFWIYPISFRKKRKRIINSTSRLRQLTLDLLGCTEDVKHEEHKNTYRNQKLLRRHIQLFYETKIVKS